MPKTRLASVMLMVFLLPAPLFSQGTGDAPGGASCTPSGAGCERTTLQSTMTKAAAVAIETPAHDRFAQAQLRRLVKQLGKQVAAPNHAADATLVLSAPEPTGVSLGPGDRVLATLQVFSGQDGKLVWVEHLRGTGDRPWPAIVDQLLTQFQATLASGNS